MMRFTVTRVPLCRVSPLCSKALSPFFPISLSSPVLSVPLPCCTLSSITTSSKTNETRWKPMCLYYTQGKCAMMDDPMHLEKFNHNCSWDLQVDASKLNRICSQNLDFFLVLDLEGKVEILEFPVLLIDAKTMEVVDFFHRFVRPSGMTEQRINEYIEAKYGKFGVHRVWHDTAIPFKDVLQQFEVWLTQHHLWEKHTGRSLNRAAFVTCGNWDLKTKVPQQCKVSKTKLPLYFMEWINLKDVYLNFYKRRVGHRDGDDDERTRHTISGKPPSWI